MGTLQFKTNIKCDGCIKKVTPFMNADLRIVQWSVDTANPEKILTVRVEQMADEEVAHPPPTVCAPHAVVGIGHHKQLEIFAGFDECIGQPHGGFRRDVRIHLPHDQEQLTL